MREVEELLLLGYLRRGNNKHDHRAPKLCSKGASGGSTHTPILQVRLKQLHILANNSGNPLALQSTVMNEKRNRKLVFCFCVD